MFKTIEWTEEGVRMIDQTRLPGEEIYRTYTDYREVAEAIRSLVIRGAPAIGVAAAMGIALGLKNSPAKNVADIRAEFETIAGTMAKTRPTAVNLFWAIKRMRTVFEDYLTGRDMEFPGWAAGLSGLDRATLLIDSPGGQLSDGSETGKLRALKSRLVAEALRILAEDIAINEAMGRHGADLMPNEGTVLTHCNAGALATGGYGTALGVIRAAVGAGKKLRVFADETRPFLQGARLTAWELAKDQIPVTIITDSMAGHFMKQGQIRAVVVGADRIAANGDTANKIGTYSVAVLAHENGIPFYVAAPLSTIDMSLTSGDQIPIEERSSAEVTRLAGVAIAPAGVEARHPAFDVTPHRYITAIITERGVARAPYTESLGALFAG
jgi:methylthioribose-1-phosphate isomerase